MEWIVGFAVVCMVLVIGLGFYFMSEKDDALAHYKQTLSKLSNDPENNELRGTVIKAGRNYISAAETYKLFSKYSKIEVSELSMQNDLNSAIGHGTMAHKKSVTVAVSQSVQSSPPPDSQKQVIETPIQKLEGLKKLLDLGAISQQEFDVKKEELLKII